MSKPAEQGIFHAVGSNRILPETLLCNVPTTDLLWLKEIFDETVTQTQES